MLAQLITGCRVSRAQPRHYNQLHHCCGDGEIGLFTPWKTGDDVRLESTVGHHAHNSDAQQ